MSIYQFSVTIEGEEISLKNYKNKVLIIVNTASRCGFTPQYNSLQKLYEKYNQQGFEVLGFPCNQFAEQEPGNNNEIKSFCQLNYGVTFPIFEKIEVKGADAHPMFKYLSSQAPFIGFDKTKPADKILYAMLSEKSPQDLVGDSIKWNFTKFLIDREGKIVKRFESTVDPLDMESEIVNCLNKDN